jgi:ribonuclease HI
VIFTDASGSGNAAYFSSQGQKVVQTGFSTAQHAELQAVILACQDFVHVPFNLYTDSAYVCGVVKAIETSYIGYTSNDQLFHIFTSYGHYFNNVNIFILWAISGPFVAFLGHW